MKLSWNWVLRTSVAVCALGMFAWSSGCAEPAGDDVEVEEVEEGELGTPEAGSTTAAPPLTNEEADEVIE